MPLVQVTLREGRSADLVREMITAVTDAVVTSLGAPRHAVQVVVTEVPAARDRAPDGAQQA
jgi:4-oxalocrotonate tautomerase